MSEPGSLDWLEMISALGGLTVGLQVLEFVKLDLNLEFGAVQCGQWEKGRKLMEFSTK